MTPEYPGSIPKCFDPGLGTSEAVTVGAATLLAKGLESLGRSTGASRTNTEENHVVCVLPFGYSRSQGGHLSGW